MVFQKRVTIIVMMCIVPSLLKAQSDIIYINGLEKYVIINDTGVTWAGHSSSANNAICESNMDVLQDCDYGRDSDILTNNEDGVAGFSFYKVDILGQELPNSAKIWACVKDNVTGLTWEVKTTDEGVHYKDNIYRWGGLSSDGIDHPDRIGNYYKPSWNDLINDSNNNRFCGKRNWRAPNILELSSLSYYAAFLPAIDIDYFPNTLNEVRSIFWTSSPTAGTDNGA